METMELHTYDNQSFESYDDTFSVIDESLTALSTSLDNLQGVVEYLWNENILRTEEANKADSFLIEMTKQMQAYEVYINKKLTEYGDLL